jgi:hypothetical protein
MFGSTCGESFREFTVIFHDEVHAAQAFAELENEDNPLSLIRDGMGINYGVSSMGSLVMSTPALRRTGVGSHCPECRAEEFFLSSWANGDPALILDYQGEVPVGARYPDDPSNVHHSYLGDPVRFRNLHAGPKETHVFHLHAHQWVMDSQDPNSTYLDSQTISPGASFSYGIEFGGGGNRNLTVGDSIFHCHLYPHFAQGMWELWRVHDTFEDGHRGLFDPKRPIGPDNDPLGRNLPDAEVTAGIAMPAVVPIPGNALAPIPSAEFRGYPFYIPGNPGHRPPQPALDMDVLATANWTDPKTEPPAEAIVNGGLPRHVVLDGSLTRNTPEVLRRASQRGGEAARTIAARVRRQDPEALSTLASEWDKLTLRFLPHSGDEAERKAMQFHEGELRGTGFEPVAVTSPARPAWWRPRYAYRTDRAVTLPIQQPRDGPPLYQVNSLSRAPGAPFANPCPEEAPLRHYRGAFIQTELTYNRHGWFDPQGRIVILEDDIKDIIDPATRTRLPEPLFFRANSGECIQFLSSNFMPSALNVDDFQIYTPTDTIGQHIHLVKFDVTSSDGSGNGWNYEDATFSPDEVRERIFAHNRTVGANGPKLVPQPHPLFRPGGTIHQAAQRDPGAYGALLEKGQCPAQTAGEDDKAYAERLNERHPFCGAQRTTQRWWADPILNRVSGRDNTLRTVFTHDHFGPSSHQQHGLYAGLVVEPANSLWLQPGASLTAEEVAALGTPSSIVEEKLLGGSDLRRPTAAALRRGEPHPLAPIEPRVPLRLREDGGPTATIANIIAPDCIQDGDSNPLQPATGRNRSSPSTCIPERKTEDTRREFALAIADFGIAYNLALEPINPEPRGDSMLRDASSIRFGRRHVAATPGRPLGISSEDPGSQLVNYRHEPLALRISEASEDHSLGGYDFRQASTRSDGRSPCTPSNTDCLGDMANAFSTRVHAGRDEFLARNPMSATPTSATRELLRGTPEGTRLEALLAQVEQWRRDFNCALYPTDLLPAWKEGDPENQRRALCDPRIKRREPWRVFGDPATPILPAYEGDPVQIRLIQGAQEAQHIFTMNGVKWLRMPGLGPGAARLPDQAGPGYLNAQPLGISEHFEFDVIVNPLNAPHVDYLYFGSSVDQLWDGLWGVMRSFTRPDAGPRRPAQEVPSSASSGTASLTAERFLATLGNPAPLPPATGDAPRSVCAPPGRGATIPYRAFDVSAVRVCQLLGDCDGPSPAGLEYSRRFGIRDERAVVYVLNDTPRRCDADNLERGCGTPERRGNNKILHSLRTDFAAGRPLEPLVLRAAAGECIEVTLRNHLPPQLPNGAEPGADSKDQGPREAGAYHNFLPMITDGFNVNQFRMSNTVGISAPRVAQHPLWSDGSNVGLNGAIVDRDAGGDAFGQGSLQPPCANQEDDSCKTRLFWSATDYEHGNLPVEFGALPLRSFGDPIKHPMHGLGGALVIGPAGSDVCRDDRFAAMRGGRWPDGVSTEICAPGGRRYIDHVLMVQDGVNATRGGMPVNSLSGGEEPDDYGLKALNYRTEPLWARRGNDPSIEFEARNEMDYSRVFSSARLPDGRCAAGIPHSARAPTPCDPETPVLTARAGETVRLHFVHPGGHTRQQGLAVGGHGWNPTPWSADSRVFDAERRTGLHQGVFNAFGPMMGITLQLEAGGAARVPMDYLIRSQASFLFDNGLWGLLRVENSDGGQSRETR